MATRGPTESAVVDALAARPAPADKRDDGAVRLALQYARLIDDAAVAAKYVPSLNAMRSALDLINTLGAGVGLATERHFDKLCVALAAHSVLSDLGPKLLAALAALELTPAARSTGKGAKPDDSAGIKPVATVLDELRAKRIQRQADS